VTDALFPLPLTPFEHYYWCDDRPVSPTTFPVELTFRGTIERARFEQALRSTIARHPLLNALVDVHTARVPQWVDAHGQSPPIDWSDAAEPIRPSAVAFIDLTSVPGLRVWVRTTDESNRVVFQFHHACCDALGELMRALPCEVDLVRLEA